MVRNLPGAAIFAKDVYVLATSLGGLPSFLSCCRGNPTVSAEGETAIRLYLYRLLRIELEGVVDDKVVYESREWAWHASDCRLPFCSYRPPRE